jgi:hypothetical protein
MAGSENAPEQPGAEPVWDQNRGGRDESTAAGTSGGRGVTSGGDVVLMLGIALVALATGIVNGLSAAQEALRRGDSQDLGRLLFWEMSSVTFILAAAPILIVAVRRMRGTPAMPVKVAIGVVALAGFSALHIVGMVWLRKFGIWLAGGSYNFGASFATILYEFRKDAVTAIVIAGAVWLFDRSRAGTMPAPGDAPVRTATAEADSWLWLRDGTSRIRVAPRQILWISSAGNYIEYNLADGTTHLIRNTLAAAETELAGFRIVRIHRTRLANLARVVGVDLKPSGDFELTFDGGQRLGGSRRYRSAVAGFGTQTPPDRPAAS